MIEHKSCSKCGVIKPLTEYHRHRKTRLGVYSQCKVCKAALHAHKRASNPSQLREASLRWYHNNRDRASTTAAAWKAKNVEKRAEHWKRWYAENRERVLAARDPAKVAAAVRERQARKLKATPAWANKFFIQEAYRLAALRTRATGVRWVVDHVIPLRSKHVCGLHVEHNLQVTTFSYNARKGNKFTPGDLTPDRGPRLEEAWGR